MAGLPRALVITGPTASGKSALAKQLAAELPIEIISADSAQVYRGMDLGTAKPSIAEQQATSHHLIDIRDPAQPYSAWDFCQAAPPLIADIRNRGRIPVVVGGTLLYLKALKEGINDLPEADPQVRQQILDQAKDKGWAQLHKELERVDPQAAKRIQAGDPQRLQRALEVFRLTGKPLSHWQAQPAQPPQVEVVEIGIVPPDRAALHEQIAARFHHILAQGFLDEVRQLYRRGDLSPELPAIKAVGYRQAWAHLAGELTYDEMAAKAIAATRQLAKRQYTWLRSWQGLNELPVSNLGETLKFIQSNGIL